VDSSSKKTARFSPIYRYEFEVRPGDIDHNGHVGNLRYLEWMLEAAQRHSEAVGCDFDRCREYGGTWVAKSHHIEYRRPAFAGEVLEMETWLERVDRVIAWRRYRIVRRTDDMLLAEGETEWVWSDPASGRPRRIPAEVAEKFEGPGE
jgi:acyl-CoA thioester hydrolase